MHRLVWAIAVATSITFCTGCTSVKSTLINRTADDSFVGNSNGEARRTSATRPFNGVPITLRVPTHVDVVIKEKLLLKSDGQQHLVRLHTDKRHLFVETEIIETEKVFTVDIKRPAAGTLNYTMQFADEEGNNDQYFKSIKSRIEDKTISDITAALKSITSAKETLETETPVDPESVEIIPEIRTVAWRRFDIDACDFEAEVAAFVSQHMNDCNSCQQNRSRDFPIVEVEQAFLNSQGY